jgi:hypothetical protein
MRLGGFVADNGRLPVNVRELLAFAADELAANEGVIPVFDSTLDGDCLQTGTGTNPALGEAARLLKGHRGNYLAGAANNGEFRDGWGNVGQSDDEDNFGWTVTPDAGTNGVAFASLGADNASGRTNDLLAEDDQTMTIVDADWRVPLDGWQVTVKNANLADSGATVNLGAPGELHAALLVFENVGTSGRWRQYKSYGGTCGTSLAGGESCQLTFADESVCTGGSIAANVPLGRHVLVLFKDDGPLAKTYGVPANGYAVAQVDFYPGTLPPPITLEVR